MFSLAIVGRPNVGKSTLFNKLAGKKLAIVNDMPGVTRDWREAPGSLFDQSFRIIDTAGLEEAFDDSIQARMRQQTESALKQADVVLFMVDGRSGITPMDKHFASWLRKQKKPVILAVNKCENPKTIQSSMAEAYGLGLGDPIAISAEHGEGMEDLYHVLRPYYPDEEDEEEVIEDSMDNLGDIDEIEGDEEFTFQQSEDDPEKPIKLAIVGKPNVGKSTLMNAIVGEQRSMTGPEAGITRDAVTMKWEYEGRAFTLVDTAGMRRRAKVQNEIEKMSVEDSLRAIRLAQVVVLVIDGTTLMDKQDLQIAQHIIEEGRALVIAVNKWDAVTKRKEALEELAYQLETSLGQLSDAPTVTLSALNGNNIDGVMQRALKTYAIWNTRIATAGLNRWLARMESQNPAPLVSGRRNRLKYITQIKTRPPTFAVWAARPDKLPDSHKRYLINGIRRDYDIPGVPVRLLVRRSKNPYTDE